MKGGSFFFAEIRRTVSSLSPRGMTSDSMSVTNPYLYSPVVSLSSVVLTGSPLVVPRDVVGPAVRISVFSGAAARAGRLLRAAGTRLAGRAPATPDAARAGSAL